MSLHNTVALQFLLMIFSACSKMDNGAFPTDSTINSDISSFENHSSSQQTQSVKVSKDIKDLPFGWELMSAYDIEKNAAPMELAKYFDHSVTIRGFMIPMDWEAKSLTEFILLPYVPSCSHVPPPAENQQILVTLAKGKKTTPSWFPFEVTGMLRMNSIKLKAANKTANTSSESFGQADQMREMPYFSIEANSFKEIK